MGYEPSHFYNAYNQSANPVLCLSDFIKSHMPWLSSSKDHYKFRALQSPPVQRGEGWHPCPRMWFPRTRCQCCRQCLTSIWQLCSSSSLSFAVLTLAFLFPYSSFSSFPLSKVCARDMFNGVTSVLGMELCLVSSCLACVCLSLLGTGHMFPPYRHGQWFGHSHREEHMSSVHIVSFHVISERKHKNRVPSKSPIRSGLYAIHYERSDLSHHSKNQNASQRLFFRVPVRETVIWQKIVQELKRDNFRPNFDKIWTNSGPPDWNPEKQSLGQILDKFGVLAVFEWCKRSERSQFMASQLCLSKPASCGGSWVLFPTRGRHPFSVPSLALIVYESPVPVAMGLVPCWVGVSSSRKGVACRPCRGDWRKECAKG